MPDLKIAIVLGSTRTNRNGAAVADWVLQQAAGRDAAYDLIDLADHPLPFLALPASPAYVPPTDEAVVAWGELVGGYDGYVFVTPEYNHSTSGVLKNALDTVYWPWTNKAAAFAGYGSVGGVRAVEHLRGILSELQIAHVRQTLAFSLFTDFTNMHEFTPSAQHAEHAATMFGQLEAWAAALQPVRAAAAAAA